MGYKQEIIDVVGKETFGALEKIAEQEVALALKMPLVDEYRQKKYYRQRPLAEEMVEYSKLFQQKGLKISPLDVTNILFRCKIMFAVTSDDEYTQRIGDVSWVDEVRFAVRWSDRPLGVDRLIDEYFDRHRGFLRQRTVITEISDFHGDAIAAQDFFDGLFQKLDLPFRAFFESERLVERHQEDEPGMREYILKEAKRYFNAPSIGFEASGSYLYCYFFSTAWLRTFFNLLRIAGFVYPAQIDFGFDGPRLRAPISSVMLGEHSSGCFVWDQDTKEPWLKSPDGCLFLSFGFRGLSFTWFDTRTFGSITRVLDENKELLDHFTNPWTDVVRNEIEPTLDILNSATQIPDIGAKILLLYCCLEHLFVPSGIVRDNKKYIVGGINALRPSLLSWFDRLYVLRCDYAHKGYVKRDERTRSLIFESARNVLLLLRLKVTSRVRD